LDDLGIACRTAEQMEHFSAVGKMYTPLVQQKLGCDEVTASNRIVGELTKEPTTQLGTLLDARLAFIRSDPYFENLPIAFAAEAVVGAPAVARGALRLAEDFISRCCS
jgi:hypothetical protein